VLLSGCNGGKVHTANTPLDPAGFGAVVKMAFIFEQQLHRVGSDF